MIIDISQVSFVISGKEFWKKARPFIVSYIKHILIEGEAR